MEKLLKLLISDDGAEWNRDAARAFQTAGFELNLCQKRWFYGFGKNRARTSRFSFD